MAAEDSGELTLSELIASAAVMKCSQCEEVFKEPVLLPCLHSFCTDCLVNLLLDLDHATTRSAQNGLDKAEEERSPSPPVAPVPPAHSDEPELDGGACRVNTADDSDDVGSKGDHTGGNRNSQSEGETASVSAILREIEGRRTDPTERGWIRPRRLRPLSAKPERAAARRSTPESAQCSAHAGPIPADPTSTTSCSESNAGRVSSLPRQINRARLSLVCPACGHAVQLTEDVLLRDDIDAEFKDQDGDDTKGLQLRKTSASAEGQQTADAKDGMQRGLGGSNIPISLSLSTCKLRTLLKKTIAASLLPNHFLNSLATIHRHKYPGKITVRENNRGGNREKSENGGHSTESAGTGEGLLCAYCITEGQTVDASSFCLDCNDRMCETCSCAHRKTRITRNHTVAPLGSIRQGLFDHDLRAREHVVCWSHRGEPVSCFCCDCITAVCKRCRAGQHRAHKVMSLPEISAKIEPELHQIQRAIGRRVPSLADYLAFLEEQVTKLDSKKQLVAREICVQTQLVHEMIEEHKQKLLSRLELACARQRSDISAKIQETARAKDSLSRTAGFLSHLRRLGRADEIVVSYGSVVDFYRRLVNSSSYAGDTDRPTGGGKPATGSSDELRTADSAKRSSTACPALTTRLACVFTAGPCTETNIGILLGPLDLHKVPLNAEDSPQTKLPLTCLMPKRLQRPSVQLAFHTDVPGDQSPTYPSGLALHPRLLAVVDRENAVVKMFDRTSGSFLRTIGGDGSSRLVKPFDVVFLDKTGTTVAVSDSEAGAVRVFETLSGKFLRSFAGEIRHPRGLAVTPGTGQVVVVDGHLRHFTFHDPITGEMLRRLTPSFINNGRASCPADVGRRKDHGHDRDNDNTDNIRQYSGAKENSNTSLIAPEKSYEGKKHAPHDVSEHFKSTALIDPYYIAWTLSGNLVVTDQASPNLKIVDSETGDILSQSMDYGTGLEESLHPSGLCVDRYGQILISDTNNSRVHLALPNGQLTGAVLLRGDMKTDQAKDASKNQRKLLQKEDYEEIEQTHCLDADVSEIDHCSPSVSKPLCLAIDDDTGHLVVAQAGGQVKMIRYM